MNNILIHTEKLKDRLPQIREKFNIEEISIFGSFARKENNQASDLDILVSFKSTPSLFTLERLRKYLFEILKVKIDVVVDDGLEPNFRERIFKERVRI